MYMLILFVNGVLPWDRLYSLSKSQIISLKKNLTAAELTVCKAEAFRPILELLYSYEYCDEPEYNKIIFMFEKILLDQNITPSHLNFDWIKPDI